VLPRADLDRLIALSPKAPLRRVHDPLEGEVVVRRHGEPEIGHGVAAFLPLVEAGPADDAVGQADGQEAVLEGSHLVRRAHEDRHPLGRDRVHAAGAPLHRLDLLPIQRASSSPSQWPISRTFSPSPKLGPQRLAEPPLVPAITAEAAARMCGVLR
jgi:hypothetical protein